MLASSGAKTTLVPTAAAPAERARADRRVERAGARVEHAHHVGVERREDHLGAHRRRALKLDARRRPRSTDESSVLGLAPRRTRAPPPRPKQNSSSGFL
eukprot:2567395-Prymnesium_polylepis.1